MSSAFAYSVTRRQLRARVGWGFTVDTLASGLGVALPDLEPSLAPPLTCE